MTDGGSKRFQRTREDHRSEQAEDYVELVHHLIQESGSARVVHMATRLGVSEVTVSKTLRRLAREGFVVARPYSSITLTEKGRTMALQAEERHNIVVKFLLHLGIPPETAEADAEGIEHHVSPITLDAMRRQILG